MRDNLFLFFMLPPNVMTVDAFCFPPITWIEFNVNIISESLHFNSMPSTDDCSTLERSVIFLEWHCQLSISHTLPSFGIIVITEIRTEWFRNRVNWYLWQFILWKYYKCQHFEISEFTIHSSQIQAYCFSNLS